MPRRDAIEGVDDGLIPRGYNPNDRGNDIPNVGPEYPIENESEKPLKPKRSKPLDVNLYATKKTVAQGMMDLALLTANANQLRYVLESGNRSGPYYYISVTLISLSIILQLVIGVTLIFLGRYNLKHDEHMKRAEKLNNVVVLFVFLITIINVFVTAFGIDAVERIDPALLVNEAIAQYRKVNEDAVEL